MFFNLPPEIICQIILYLTLSSYNKIKKLNLYWNNIANKLEKLIIKKYIRQVTDIYEGKIHFARLHPYHEEVYKMKKRIYNVINKIKHGKFSQYHIIDEDILLFDCFFTFGKLNGKFTLYYQNRQPKISIFYKNNIKHGEFKVWKETGELLLQRS